MAEEKGLWGSLEIDGRMLFGGIPQICSRYLTGTLQHERQAVGIRRSGVPKQHRRRRKRRKRRMLCSLHIVILFISNNWTRNDNKAHKIFVTTPNKDFS
jgi:hypothetical protein